MQENSTVLQRESSLDQQPLQAVPTTVPALVQATADSHITQAGTKESDSNAREVSPQGRYVKLEDRLGTGAYKEVWRAYDTNDGIEVAWNVVKLSRIPPSERKRIKTEVKLLKDIEHRNVIRYFNSWVNKEREQIIFVTEIMSSGSLKDYLRKNTTIRWMALKRWCVQILTGLAFLHDNHIIHRDIKCDNIFINGATGDIRIGDLGLSTRITEARLPAVYNNNNVNSTNTANGSTATNNASNTSNTTSNIKYPEITATTMTCLGTPEFMAPEMYEESYDEKVDIYAFGMCMMEMVTGLLPYHNCASAVQIYRKVLNGELPPELDIVAASNSRAHSFIQSCLLPKAQRPSAVELLEHPFLQAHEVEDLSEVRPKSLRQLPIDEVDCEDEGEGSECSDSGGDERELDCPSEQDGLQSDRQHVPGEVPACEKNMQQVTADGAANVDAPSQHQQSEHGPIYLQPLPLPPLSTPSLEDLYDRPMPPLKASFSEPIHTSNSGEYVQYRVTDSAGGSRSPRGLTRVRRTVLSQSSVAGFDNADGGLSSQRISLERKVRTSTGSGSGVGDSPRVGSGSPAIRSSWDKVPASALFDSAVGDDQASAGHAQDNPVSVFDVQDHESLPNTLVFYLRIAQHAQAAGAGKSAATARAKGPNRGTDGDHDGNSSGTDTASADVAMPSHEEKQLEIEVEFEFDLINDDTACIAQEMLQLEDIQHHTAVTSRHLIGVFAPLVSTARTLLEGPTAASATADNSNADGNRHTSSGEQLSSTAPPSLLDSAGTPSASAAALTPTSLALRTVQHVMCTEKEWTNPAYRILKRKVSARHGTSAAIAILSAQSTDCIVDGQQQAQALSVSVGSADALDSAVTSYSASWNKLAAELQQRHLQCDVACKQQETAQFQLMVQSEEYKLLMAEHEEFINRIEQEHSQRVANLSAQRDKAQLAFSKDKSELLTRRADLIAQLDDMQLKCKERMAAFSARKNRALEAHLDAELRQNDAQVTTSVGSSAITVAIQGSPSTPPLLPALSNFGTGLSADTSVGRAGAVVVALSDVSALQAPSNSTSQSEVTYTKIS